MTIAGLAIVQRFMPNAPVMVRLAGGMLAGIVGSAWITYIVALALSGLTDDSLMVGILVTLAVHGAIIGYWGRELRIDQFRLAPFEVIFIGLALVFSFWLMDNRLAEYDGHLMVSAETWGDTALHTALSRSFSWGANYPTEYPFFANEPVRYHFGYDFFAGALQKGGMSVLLSFNLPGALGFTAMMMVLFSIGRMLFYQGEKTAHWWQSRAIWVGLIAVCVLLTNQSLEWVRWVERTGSLGAAIDPANWWNHPSDRVPGTNYLSIGPYYPDKIAIFNTLNVYLTQTHLIIGMATVLFVTFGLLQPLRTGAPLHRDRMLFLGVLFGASFWLNGVLYIAAGVFFGSLLVFFAFTGSWRHAEKVASTPKSVAHPPDTSLARQLVLPLKRPLTLPLVRPLVGVFRVSPNAPLAVPLSETVSGAFWSELMRWTKMAAWFIVPALVLAIPQSIWLNGGSLSNDGAFRTHIGYLVCSSPNSACHANGEMDLLNPRHWQEFMEYWALNEGLVFPLLAIAAFIGTRSDRKILGAVMAVFVFGSLFQLSRDLGGHNHKIFNLWEVLAAPFIAYAIVELWNIGKDNFGTVQLRMRTLQPFAWMIVPVLFFFLVVSGLLDFMTVKNDFKVPVFGDKQASIDWIDDNTAGDAVFLIEPGNLYTAPTLAGRGAFLGYDSWAGSAGYDVDKRLAAIQTIYAALSKDEACRLLTDNEIDYVLIGPDERTSDRFALNEVVFTDGFVLAGTADQSGSPVNFYDVARSCEPGNAVAVP